MEESSDSDERELYPYWSAEKGLEWQPRSKHQPSPAEEEQEQKERREQEWNDRFILYPMLAISLVLAAAIIILTGHVFIMDGTARRVAGWAARFSLALVLSFLVI